MKHLIYSILLILGFCTQAQINPAIKNNTQPIINKTQVQSALLVRDVKLDDFTEWLCPSNLLRGDREFNGNGPKVKCEVKIRISPDGNALLADFYLWAQETVHDWSTTEGRWTRKIYDAPYGMKINRILSATASRTQFISPKAGMQIFVPGADVAQVMYTFLDNTDIKSAVLQAHGIDPKEKSALSHLVKVIVDRGNQVVQVPSTEGTLVKFFHIVGDTGGEDISTDDNCNDDTRIVKIEFFPVRLEFRKVE